MGGMSHFRQAISLYGAWKEFRDTKSSDVHPLYEAPTPQHPAHNNSPPPPYSGLGYPQFADNAGQQEPETNNGDTAYCAQTEKPEKPEKAGYSIFTAGYPQPPASATAPPVSSNAKKFKPTESAPINSTTPVSLSGPLTVLGGIKCSSSITLIDIVSVVDPVISSSSDLFLSNGIYVGSRICAGKNITVLGGTLGTRISGAVDAAGDMLLVAGTGGVSIMGKVKGGQEVRIDANEGVVRIGAGLFSQRDLVLGGNVDVVGDVESDDGMVVLRSELGENGLLRIGGRVCTKKGVIVEGNLEFTGNFSVKGTLNVHGCVKVMGDLSIKGDVYMAKGSELVVVGKRTVTGGWRQD